ncbi:MAG: hypothetical protein Q7S59_01285 [Sulfurimonas sp.]|nr:hypothetical protein [Sulfurimonas sp.]
MKKYAQTKNLLDIFDLSVDYFQKRMDNDFIKGIHYFIPPTTSKTKKAVLWDIEALENWLRGNQVDSELENLLGRRG